MPISPFSGAANDLGFGGAGLAQQTEDETEEEKRRKRLGLSPLASGAVATLFGPATGLSGGRRM